MVDQTKVALDIFRKEKKVGQVKVLDPGMEKEMIEERLTFAK